jgi:hypothetical protein
MRVTIRPAVPSDAPTLAAINVDAFAGQGFVSNAFPNLGYEVVHQLKTTRYLQKIAQPRVHVLAAVDEDSGAIVGCARWSFPGPVAATRTNDRDQGQDNDKRASGAQAESTSLPLPEGTNRAVYDGFFQTLKEKGKEHLRDDDIGTHSAHTSLIPGQTGHISFFSFFSLLLPSSPVFSLLFPSYSSSLFISFLFFSSGS